MQLTKVWLSIDYLLIYAEKVYVPYVDTRIWSETGTAVYNNTQDKHTRLG